MNYFETTMPGLALAALITVGSPLAAQWVDVGKLLTPRSDVSAVKLKDGRFLVAGGQRNYGSYTGPLQDSETFTWSKGPETVSPMNQARFSHTLTLLPDGKVLATGGSYADSRCCYKVAPHLATAEIYDPTTDTWQTTGSMSFPRADHAAIALKNGTVLIVGERREVECYNPATGQFSVIAKLNYTRNFPCLIPIHDGRVLVLGMGQVDDPEAARTAEIFYPENNTFQLTQPMTQERAMRFTATRLKDGRVLIAGGDTDTAHVGTYEVFDPSTGLFTFLGRLSTDREHHTATLMRDGSVLLVGGVGITNRVPDGVIGFVPPITGPLTLVERVFPNEMKVEEVEYLDKGCQGHASFFRKNGTFGSVLVLGGECTNGFPAIQSLDDSPSPDWLRYDYLTSLSVDEAKRIMEREGRVLSLDGLNELSPEAAGVLAGFKGEELDLMGLKTLSVETAKALAGCMCDLGLNGLTSISDQAASELGRFGGDRLFLNGLTEISTAAAKSLAGYKGRLFLSIPLPTE